MKFVLSGGEMIPVVDGIVENAKETMVEHFKESILAFCLAVVDIVKDATYSIAIIGGGVCIIVWAVGGVKRAGKAFGIIVLAHMLIRFLLG